MRRADREMSREFGLAILDRCEWAVLGMTDKAGEPYGVPVTIVRDGEHLYLHGAMAGRKAECLRRGGRVCVTAVGDTRIIQEQFTTEFESVVAYGTPSEVVDEAEKIRALRLLCQRHTPDAMAGFDAAVERSLARTAIFRIDLAEVTAKRKKYGAAGRELKFGAVE